jgi:hypothetical protein
MVKDWNRRQRVALQSYHIEVIALKMVEDYWTFDDYSFAVSSWFEVARKFMWYCPYEGHDAAEYLSYDDTHAALTQLKETEVIARRAWHLTYDSNHDDKAAIALWGKLFGRKFPACS